ncbi:MAG: hypothetical protein HY819_11270 [Acidobacteria bacterium]|nr:hypothetical protein [Acidobacteriota bacterium]
MSNLKSTTKTTPTFSSTNLINTITTHYCQAQITEACHYRGGQIEIDRSIRKNTRYCYDCARKIKLKQSAEWKRNKRQEIGWQAYQEDYSPYPTKADKQKYHREYARQWRTRKKSDSNNELLN